MGVTRIKLHIVDASFVQLWRDFAEEPPQISKTLLKMAQVGDSLFVEARLAALSRGIDLTYTNLEKQCNLAWIESTEGLYGVLTESELLLMQLMERKSNLIEGLRAIPSAVLKAVCECLHALQVEALITLRKQLDDAIASAKNHPSSPTAAAGSKGDILVHLELNIDSHARLATRAWLDDLGTRGVLSSVAVHVLSHFVDTPRTVLGAPSPDLMDRACRLSTSLWRFTRKLLFLHMAATRFNIAADSLFVEVPADAPHSSYKTGGAGAGASSSSQAVGSGRGGDSVLMGESSVELTDATPVAVLSPRCSKTGADAALRLVCPVHIHVDIPPGLADDLRTLALFLGLPADGACPAADGS